MPSYGPCFHKRTNDGRLYKTCIGSQQNLKLRDKSKVTFARAMREEDIAFTYRNYLKWRQIESLANKKAFPLVVDLSLDATPLKPDIKTIIAESMKRNMSLDTISMKTLHYDTPEAVIGYYEPYSLGFLDGRYHQKFHPQCLLRFHPMADRVTKRTWVSLYFRRHIVAAFEQQNHIIVINSADRQFCDMRRNTPQKNEQRRKFYERVFKKLARLAFRSNKPVRIRHMNVQGANDCSIWINLIPLLFKGKNKDRFEIENPEQEFDKFIRTL